MSLEKKNLEDKENSIIFYACDNQLMKTNQVYLDIKLTSDYVWFNVKSKPTLQLYYKAVFETKFDWKVI